MFLREVVSEAAGKQQTLMDHVLTIPSKYSFNHSVIGCTLKINTLSIKISIMKESDFTMVCAFVSN